MNINVKNVIKNSKAEAEKLIGLTAEIRKEYAVGRPNLSKESTVEGALEAFSIIVSKFNPEYKS